MIQNPVTVVDKNAEQHCVEDVASSFVTYLHSPDAKALYTDVGFLRSTDEAAAQKGGAGFPAIQDLWTVDDFGGWSALNQKLFGQGGDFTTATGGTPLVTSSS